jgi:hypothetical protein
MDRAFLEEMLFEAFFWSPALCARMSETVATHEITEQGETG